MGRGRTLGDSQARPALRQAALLRSRGSEGGVGPALLGSRLSRKARWHVSLPFQKNVRWWPELGYQQKGPEGLFYQIRRGR